MKRLLFYTCVGLLAGLFLFDYRCFQSASQTREAIEALSEQQHRNKQHQLVTLTFYNRWLVMPQALRGQLISEFARSDFMLTTTALPVLPQYTAWPMFYPLQERLALLEQYKASLFSRLQPLGIEQQQRVISQWVTRVDKDLRVAQEGYASLHHFLLRTEKKQSEYLLIINLVVGALFLIMLAMLLLHLHRERQEQKAQLQRAEHKLKEESKRFRTIVEIAPFAMVMVNTEGVIEMVNTRTEEIFGYCREKLLGQLVEILLPTDIRKAHPQLRMNFVNSPSIRSMGSGRDLYATRRNGDAFPVEVGLTPIEAEDGLKILASIVDISQRKQLEQRFCTIVESAPFSIVIINTDGVIEMTNARTEEVFGYSEEELIGQFIEILLPPHIRKVHPQLRMSFVNNPSVRGMGSGRDLFAISKCGKEFPVEIGLTPIDAEDGLKIMASIVDISLRKQHEQQLERYTVELERSNKELNDFAHVASHDLKAPLRGIQQLAGWIEEKVGENSDEELQRFFFLLNNRVSRLENLLSDLLAFSRAGKKSNDYKLLNFDLFVQEIFELLAPPPEFQLQLDGPPLRFKTLHVPLDIILRNLINNGIKHHDKTKGVIRVSYEERPGCYLFMVADDGPGIDPAHYHKVFEIFQTLKPRDEVEGSGMGMAIVKKLVETYQGEVHISANTPRGTCFHFTWLKEGALKDITYDG